MIVLEKVIPMFSIIDIFTLIFLSLLVFSLLYLLKKFDRQLFSQQGIPWVKLNCLNFVGHIRIIPRGSAFYKLYPQDVYSLQTLESFRIIHSKDVMFCVWLLNNPFIFLTKAASVEALLKSTQVLEKSWSYNALHPWLSTGLLTSKGKKWKSRRKILTPAFHFDILKDFLPVFNEKANVLNGILKEATSKEWVDIVRLFTLCSLDIICETTLGVNIDAQKREHSEYVRAIFRISELTVQRMRAPMQWLNFLFFRSKIGKKYLKDLDCIHSFTRNIIREKKNTLKLNVDLKKHSVKAKRQALMDLLLNHHMVYQDFTEEDVREEVDTFAFEGHDTTAMGLSWSLYMIGLYPHIQEKVHEELDMIFGDDDRHITTEELKDMKYLECVIKEVQRLYPSVPIIGRQITENFDIGRRHIPKGTACLAFLYGLHRDPDVFPNPEIFDPERFFPENVIGRHPYAYVPFAAGPRNCIGQRFAMMELKVVLATVLRSFTVQALDTRDKILPAAELVLRPSRQIRMKVVSRNK